MKRLSRRTFGAVVGLVLGWYICGVTQPMWEAQPSFAHDDPAAHPASADDASGGAHPPAAGATGHKHDEHGHAPNLVPAEGAAPFIKPVLITAACLFLAAVTLGQFALKLRGPEPPDPAEEAEHDDHGHDDHGDGSHGGDDAKPGGH